jgi:mannose-6-phosphate isomerase-like protein (cupin superfamily)
LPPEKLNILDQVDAQITQVFDPHIVADVNDAQVKVAKFGPLFDWHSHPAEDEAFLVLRGRIAIDFRDGVVELGQGEFLCVPRGVEHRPRALTPEPVVIMVEPAGTVNTGDAESALTVAAPKRLQAEG